MVPTLRCSVEEGRGAAGFFKRVGGSECSEAVVGEAGLEIGTQEDIR